MRKEPKYVAETLAWCNKMRKEFGKRPLKKLPKGERTNPLSCPCGKATGLSVMYSHATEAHGPSKYYKLPIEVQRFVRAFDSGRLPQYVKGAK